MSDVVMKVVTTVSAIVTRADGTVEDLGIVSHSETDDPVAVTRLQDKLTAQATANEQEARP